MFAHWCDVLFDVDNAPTFCYNYQGVAMDEDVLF